MPVSPCSQSDDPESQVLTDGVELQMFSVKDRVSSSTDAIVYVMVKTGFDIITMVR